MTKPNYLVDVRWGGGVNCLGQQLEELLEFIELYSTSRDTIWYASDLDSSPIPECIRKFGDFIPKKVGNTRALIAICQQVTQFRSGIFLAFSNDVGDHLKEEFGTEDEEFRDIGAAVLEIRAFDTTFLEVYTNDYDLVRKIVGKFHCEILTEDILSNRRKDL
jgi:hypothetical protein